MEAKYKLGDKVWYAGSGTVKKSFPCPECFGKCHLIVILGDDSRVPIPCQSCNFRDESNWSSYDAYPHGYVNYYEFEARARLVEITRVEITDEKVEYGFDSCYSMDEDMAFDSEEDAVKKATELSIHHTEEEKSKVYRKEKHNRTWAWNLHYHRDCIKRAERDLAYHTAKATWAKSQVKDEKSKVSA